MKQHSSVTDAKTLFFCQPMQRGLFLRSTTKIALRTSSSFRSATMCELATKFSGKIVVLPVSFHLLPFPPR